MSNAIDLVGDAGESTAELVTCPPVPAALKPAVIVVPAPGEGPEGAATTSNSSSSNTAGSEFQMSRCVVLRNGALLLPSVQSTSDSWFAVPLPEAHPKAPQKAASPQRASPAPAEGASAPEASFDGIDLPAPMDDVDDDDGNNGGPAADGDTHADAGDVVPSTPPSAETGGNGTEAEAKTGAPATMTMTLRERRKSRTLELRTGSAQDDVVVEQWELLDPHEAAEVPMRPFRRGRTYRIPKELLQPPGTQPATSTTTSSGNNKEEAASSSQGTVRIRAPFFSEFDDLYEAEMRRRRSALNTRRREEQRRARTEEGQAAAQRLAATVMGSAASAVLPATEDAFFEDPYAVMREDVGELDVDARARDDDSDDDDDNNNAGDAGVRGGDAFDDVWAQPLNYLDDDEDDEAAHGGFDLSCLSNTVCVSKRLSICALFHLRIVHCPFAFSPSPLQQPTGDVVADRYREEMRLVARINDWHTRLEPILEVQEGRHGFDIQECAVELLDTIRTEQEHADARADAGAEQETHDIGFASMVRGREPWEVCRYFLSSLLLMNCGNIQVASREPLEFCVKSTVPCFDAADAFQMAQEQQQKQQQQGEYPESAPAVAPVPVGIINTSSSSDSSSDSSDSDVGSSRTRRGATKRRRKQRR